MGDESKVYSLDEIAGDHDIVLIDSGVCQSKGNLPERMYDCHEELFLDIEEVKERTDDLMKLMSTLCKNPHICTIKGVVDEIRKYRDILNEQADYHSKNIKKKANKRSTKRFIKIPYGTDIDSHTRKRDSKIKKRKRKEEDNDLHEEIMSYNKLRVYSNRVFILNSILEHQIYPLDSEDALTKKVIKMSEEKGLKMDFSYRYPTIHCRKRDKEELHTDEMIVSAAYKLAFEENSVGIVSNDSDIRRILNACSEETETFKLPEKGNIVLYSDFQGNRDYRMKIDLANQFVELKR